MNCPICGKPNHCAAEQNPAASDCWCFHERFPDELLKRVPDALKGKACICQSCVRKANQDRQE